MFGLTIYQANGQNIKKGSDSLTRARLQENQQIHPQKETPNAQYRLTAGQYRTGSQIGQVQTNAIFYTRSSLRILANRFG